MPIFKISVHQEEWLTYLVEAEDEEEAWEIVSDGECNDFKSEACDFSILEIKEIEE